MTTLTQLVFAFDSHGGGGWLGWCEFGYKKMTWRDVARSCGVLAEWLPPLLGRPFIAGAREKGRAGAGGNLLTLPQFPLVRHHHFPSTDSYIPSYRCDQPWPALTHMTPPERRAGDSSLTFSGAGAGALTFASLSLYLAGARKTLTFQSSYLTFVICIH